MLLVFLLTMPGLLHELLVLLFRARPALAPELIVDTLGVSLPDYDEVAVGESNLTQILPTELRADVVVLLRAGDPVLGIVVEVQLGRDDDLVLETLDYCQRLRSIPPGESFELRRTPKFVRWSSSCPLTTRSC